MRIALIKIGARVGSGGSNAGSGDTLMIASMLKKCDCDIHIYTKLLSSDNDFYSKSSYKWFDLLTNYKNINSKNYDCLIVMNGNVNFYGGVENAYEIYNYITLNNFDGKVFYILCDPNLALKQITKSMESKSWNSKYKNEKIFIDREDIICITQINNIEVVKNKIIEKQKIKFKDVLYYSLEKFPLLKNRLSNAYPKRVDLKYGGAFRNAQREKKLIQFLFGHNNIDVEIFGTIRLDKFNPDLIKDLNPPRFANAVKYDNFINEMSDSLSTIIVGDKIYEGNVLTQRIYEGVLANNVVFIDNKFDPNKKAFNNQYNYVENREELCAKILELKNNIKMASDICDSQYDYVKIDSDSYCSNFYNTLKGFI